MGWLRRMLRVARRDRMRNEYVKSYVRKKRYSQQNKEEATDLVWPCYKNGRKTAATKSNAPPYRRDSECRKTAKKWIDNIKDDIADLGLNIRSNRLSKRSKKMETSSDKLIDNQRLTEERRRICRIQQSVSDQAIYLWRDYLNAPC